MLNVRSLAASALLLAASALSAQTNKAITIDPAADKANPASMQSFQVPSHGAGLNAIMYIAAGAGLHPVVVLLHGFPGNEKNLDLAQALRRDGWDVLYFDYRGSWGTPGDFSFAHCMEDAQAALAYVRDPVNAAKLRADPKTIVLAGHSMGGMIAAYTAAHDANIRGVALISAADMAGRTRVPETISAADRKAVQSKVAAGLAREGLAPLAGCTPDSLAADLMAQADEWSLVAQADKLAKLPVLVVTSDDGLAPVNEKLVAAIKAAGDQDVKMVHMSTDHSYSDKRIQLEQTVLSEMDSLTNK